MLSTKMLSSRVTSLLTILRNQNCRFFAEYTVRRRPLRYLDDDGKELPDVEGLEPIESDPQPDKEYQARQSQQKVRFKNHRKQRSASIKDINDSRSFMRTVIAINSGAIANSLVLEGERLIEDASRAGASIQKIYYSRENFLNSPRLASLLKDDSIPKIRVTQDDMKLASKVVTSPGILAICRKPSNKNIIANRKEEEILPVSVVAWLHDPGNAGGVIRTAAAVGVRNLMFPEQSCNVWEPKVTRTAMGGHFRVPINDKVSWDSIAYKLKNCEKVFYADNHLNEKSVIYHKAKFFEGVRSVALIIGSEVQGLPAEGQELLKSRDAQHIHIPMSNGVESLNGYISSSVILYEMRKQYCDN